MLPSFEPSISWNDPADREKAHLDAASARAAQEEALRQCEDRGREYRRIVQRLVFCTLLDPAGGPDAAWSALSRLHRDSADRLRTTTDQSSLSLASAIWHRRWQLGACVQDLRVALVYASRAARVRPSGDLGRNALNAALLLDLLAAIEESNEAPHGAPGASDLQRQAQELRQAIVHEMAPLADAFPDMDWTFHSTLAEALFGLGQHSRAVDRLRGVERREWEMAQTASRLAALARTQSSSGEQVFLLRRFRAWRAVARIAGGPAMRSLQLGKTGIALLGEGDAAVAFHHGALTRLQERDILRHVQVTAATEPRPLEFVHAEAIELPPPEDPGAIVRALTDRGCETLIILDGGVEAASPREARLRARVIEGERVRLAARRRVSLLRELMWVERGGDLSSIELRARGAKFRPGART